MRRLLIFAALLMTVPIFAQTPNATATVTVTPALVPAKMTITPVTASVAAGTAVVFTVTLSGTGTVPTGTVQLYNGSTLVAGGLGTLVNGSTTCTLATTGAAAGSYSISAVYIPASGSPYQPGQPPPVAP